ncbi:MAG: hypothetical protein V2B19_22915, partial [Pseudomonadota bacterium]
MPISASGIEQAIAGLNYRNPSAVKCRLLNVIRQYYQDLESPEAVRVIATDDLVKKMWDVEPSPAAIQSKRKNLNSIKSTINADLDRAWREGRNPEGIMIGPDNTFAMSNEAKDRMLASFSGAVSSDGAFKMDDVNAALNLISEFLSSRKGSEIAGELAKLKALVSKASEETGDDAVSGDDAIKKGENKALGGVESGEKTGGSGAGPEMKILDDSTTGERTEPMAKVNSESLVSEAKAPVAPEQDVSTVPELDNDQAPSEQEEKPLPGPDATTEADGSEIHQAMETPMTDSGSADDEAVLTEYMEPEVLSESTDDDIELEEIKDIEDAEAVPADELEEIPDDLLDEIEVITESGALSELEGAEAIEETEEIEDVEEVEETEEIEFAPEDEIEEIVEAAVEPVEEASPDLDEDLELLDE